MRTQIDEKLKSFGLTPEGRAFVVKALDPACVGSSPGIPDQSACSVLRPEYTVQYTIGAPAVATSTWDLMCVFPPGDVLTCVFAYGPSGTDFSSSTVPTGGGVGWVPLQTSIDPPGSIQCTTIAPAASNGTITRSIRTPTSGALVFRHMYKSVTAELLAPAVNDQGDVYAAQYPLERFGNNLLGVNFPSTATGNNIMAQSTKTRIPCNEADLTLSARNPYVGRARDGVYMPLKLVGPSQDFCPLWTAATGYDNATSSHFLRGTASGVIVPQCLFYSNNDTGGPQNGPFINSIYGNSSVQFDTGYDNTSIGVMIWRGLASSGGGGGFGASVMLKVIVGQEICPKPTAFDRVYLKPPVRYEPLAMQAYYTLMTEMQSAFPAKYNAMGALLPLLGSVAARLLPAIASGGRTFLREMLGEERAAERKQEPKRPARAPSVASRVSVRSSLAKPGRRQRKKVGLPASKAV